MFVTLKDMEDIYRKYTGNRNCVMVEITQECNFNCHFCNYNHEGKGKILDLKLFEDFMRPLEGQDIAIVLFGGEPTLEMEMCKQTIEMCKKYGFLTSMFSNGWWGKNEKVLKEIEEINFDYIYISTDRLHAEFVSADIIENIFRYFEHNQNTRILTISVFDTQEGEAQNKDLDFLRNLNFDGAKMALALNNYLFEEDIPHEYCMTDGILFEYNGILKHSCPLGAHACTIGHARDLDGKAVYKNFIRPIENRLMKKLLNINDHTEISKIDYEKVDKLLRPINAALC